MTGLVRMLAVAGAAAASMLSIESASAGCGCGFGFPGPAAPSSALPWYEPYAAPAPLQPSFFVEQGPTYRAVIVAPEDAQRWLRFPHPHPYPYIHTWYGHRHWWATRVAAEGPYRRWGSYGDRHYRRW